jgi:hypothetical protein
VGYGVSNIVRHRVVEVVTPVVMVDRFHVNTDRVVISSAFIFPVATVK